MAGHRNVIIAAFIGLLFATEARAGTKQEIQALQEQLRQNLAKLETAATAIAHCDDPDNCDLRLWIAERFVTATLSELLSNRNVSLTQTGGVSPFLDGGDALGCGWYVNIGGLSATLALGQVTAAWVPSGQSRQLLLHPNFAFGARAQVSGHVNGPPGPCSLFNWNCNCPIGGGIGASVGVSASAADALPIAVSFQAAARALTIIVNQPNPKRVDVNAGIGLGVLGTVRFRIPVELPRTELYRQPIPMAFGTQGSLNVGGQMRAYALGFTLTGPIAEHAGLALRSRVTVNWTP